MLNDSSLKPKEQAKVRSAKPTRLRSLQETKQGQTFANDQAKTENKPTVPELPGIWTEKQIIEALRYHSPESMTKKLDRSKGGGIYYPWYNCVKILNRFAPGWRWEIRNIAFSENRIFLIGRLTLLTAQGEVWREATGTENLTRDKFDEETGQLEEGLELAYGDPSSNAESMALRRCCSKFGLGINLYG